VQKEEWQSGRMYLTRNQEYRKVPWVRIPPLPPEWYEKRAPAARFSFLLIVQRGTQQHILLQRPALCIWRRRRNERDKAGLRAAHHLVPL
jgi:hypothetical protein